MGRLAPRFHPRFPPTIESHPPALPDSFAGSRTVAFACHGCGDCCKGSTVILSPFDLARLCARAGGNPRALVKERGVLLKHPQTNLPTVMLETVPQCSFLGEEKRCTVYEDRPLVCRGYPLGALVDLNEPGWRAPLRRFALRANPCPAPSPRGAPLPMVQTMHSMATAAGMEPYAEAYRAWARLTWDICATWRYGQMSPAEGLAFDREFVRAFFEELEAPADEVEALAAFLRRVEAFRARHQIPRASGERVSNPPAASRA